MKMMQRPVWDQGWLKLIITVEILSAFLVDKIDPYDLYSFLYADAGFTSSLYWLTVGITTYLFGCVYYSYFTGKYFTGYCRVVHFFLWLILAGLLFYNILFVIGVINEHYEQAIIYTRDAANDFGKYPFVGSIIIQLGLLIPSTLLIFVMLTIETRQLNTLKLKLHDMARECSAK